MRTSRRDLIRLGAAAAVASLIPGRASAASPRSSQGLVDAGHRAILAEGVLLTRTVLSGQVDTAFRVQGGTFGGAVLRLRTVADLPSAASAGLAGDDLSFSALFAGPPRVELPQATYTVRHDALGTFAIFLVPVGRAGKDRVYEATFNRLDF